MVTHQINELTSDVVARASAGDLDAFGLIYERLERPIYNHCYRMMDDADDAYDLTVDAFVKLWGALPRARPNTNISALTYRIATNACLDVLRRRQRLRWVPWDHPAHDHLRPASDADDPAWSAEQHEMAATIRAALARLRPHDRALLLLYDEDGLNLQAIAEMFGMRRTGVKSARHRALLRLRQAYVAVGGRMEVTA